MSIIQTLQPASFLILNSSAADAASTRIRDVTSTTFSIESAATTGVYDYLVLDDNGSSSALGKYTGNASSGGPYIATGHRPRLLIIKSLTTARDWVVFDTARDPDNVADARIDFSTAGAEFAAALDVIFWPMGLSLVAQTSTAMLPELATPTFQLVT